MKKKVSGGTKGVKKTSNTKAKKNTYHQEDLREKILVESLKIIYDTGVSSLSLRDVARRLNVSHSAPYRHFQSKDVLI